jgi:Bacterial Ig-like domain (group 1)
MAKPIQRRCLVLVVLGCWILVLLTCAVPLVAQQGGPGTLIGEDMLSTALQGSIYCDEPFSSFVATGTATGPYPGTFLEQTTNYPAPNSYFFGRQFSADFFIHSPFGPVSGHKEGYTPISSSCQAIPIGGGRFKFQILDSFLTQYTAKLPFGNGCTVTGTALVNLVFVTDGNGFIQSGSSMDEQMQTSTACAPPIGPPAVVSLSPIEATNPVGTSHTVTATVVDANGNPVPGQTVFFTVTGADSVNGNCTTDTNGQCSFTYQGPQLPGADVITGCAGNGNTPPCGEANKQWILPASTPGQVTGGGQIVMPPSDRVSFGFNAKSDGTSTSGNCNVIDHDKQIHIKCIDVTNLVVVGRHATFFGTADQDGTSTDFRIDVDDLATPGSGMDTFKIQTGAGYVAGGFLTAGNIQIH